MGRRDERNGQSGQRPPTAGLTPSAASPDYLEVVHGAPPTELIPWAPFALDEGAIRPARRPNALLLVAGVVVVAGIAAGAPALLPSSSSSSTVAASTPVTHLRLSFPTEVFPESGVTLAAAVSSDGSLKALSAGRTTVHARIGSLTAQEIVIVTAGTLAPEASQSVVPTSPEASTSAVPTTAPAPNSVPSATVTVPSTVGANTLVPTTLPPVTVPPTSDVPTVEPTVPPPTFRARRLRRARRDRSTALRLFGLLRE